MSKPVQLPRLGILVPTAQLLKKVALKKENLDQLEKVDLSELIFVVNPDFQNATGLGVPTKKLVRDGQELIPPTLSGDDEQVDQLAGLEKMMILNFSQVAKVCQTDARSVEAIYYEIVEQLLAAVKKGVGVRLSLKVGRLEVRNDQIIWKQYSDFLHSSIKPLLADAVTGTSTKNNSRYTRNSANRSETGRHSVITPSLRTQSFAATPLSRSVRRSQDGKSKSMSRTFHMSNPNDMARPTDYPYKGVNKIGYKDWYKQPHLQLERFGKRVDYSTRLTSKELMDDHLKQIREKMFNSRNSYIMKKEQEKEFIRQLADIEKAEHKHKALVKEMVRHDYRTSNKLLQDHNKRITRETRMLDHAYKTFFPFVGQETHEEKRASRQ